MHAPIQYKGRVIQLIAQTAADVKDIKIAKTRSSPNISFLDQAAREDNTTRPKNNLNSTELREER